MTNNNEGDSDRAVTVHGVTLLVDADGQIVRQQTPGGWVALRQIQDRWGKGYRRVRLLGKSKTVAVHKVVALAYHGDPPSPRHVMVEHLDGSRSRNAAHNVKWATHADNLNSALRLGERPRHAPVVLDEHTVYRLRRHHTRAEIAALAAELGTGTQTIRDVFDRNTWRHVRDDQPRLFDA